MKISYNWLKEFLDFSQTPEEICHILTFLGIETNIAENSARKWEKVITAKVLEKANHPNADKLSLCTVFDGSNNYSVVCGAANVAQGQIVPLAIIGAKLQDGTRIEKAKIRGVESHGMICSKKELGLSYECDGIMILDENTELGKPLEEVLGSDGVILEAEIAINRPDCLSHWGIARELAAKLQKQAHIPEIKRKSVGQDIKITIENYELCPRYIGCRISNVKVGPSPEWLSNRLRSSGIRPINNIVDITNYVLLELGHPLHAFDIDKLSNNEIIVRNAKKDEEILALDSKEYKLNESMLVISDSSKTQAVAGIIGGEKSGVTEKTKTIILESALFMAGGIRRTAKSLNIITESSYRFERGTAWETAEIASWRAVNLIEEITGGRLESRVDKTKSQYVPLKIELRPRRIKDVLNIDFSEDEIRQKLYALGIKVDESDGKFVCTIPSWRLDLKQEVDLIEELARLKGYENVQTTILPILPDITQGITIKPAEQILRQRFVGLGFNEVINYSLLEEKQLEFFGLKSFDRIANPLSKENELLRPNLLCGLWKNLILNIGQGYGEIRMFETGTVFEENNEHKSIALLVNGHVWPEWWGWEERKISPLKFDYYFFGGIISNIMQGNDYRAVSGNCPEFYHPSKSAKLELNGKIVGEFGMLSPGFCSEYGEIGYAEFNLDIIESCWNREIPKYEQLRRFPPAKRDLSVIADKKMSFEEIYGIFDDVISRGSILREAALFSRYAGEKIDADKVSYSFHLMFRHHEHTLTDLEVNKEVEKILNQLAGKNITLR